MTLLGLLPFCCFQSKKSSLTLKNCINPQTSNDVGFPDQLVLPVAWPGEEKMIRFCLSFSTSSETGRTCWDQSHYNQNIRIANEEFLEVNIGQVL